MKKTFKLSLLTVLILTSLASMLCPLTLVSAATGIIDEETKARTYEQDQAFSEASGLSQAASVGSIAAIIIETILGLLGIIFITLLVYAGYQWMMAAGNEEKVTKAKETITRAIIGLAIVIAAYSITYFVFNSLNNAAGGSGGGAGTERPM